MSGRSERSIAPLLIVARPSYLVFHGGSGSTKEEIKTAVGNGVVKMNVDTGARACPTCSRHRPLTLLA